jgi:hypothetical protein
MKERIIVAQNIKLHTKYLEMNCPFDKKSTSVAIRLLDDTP